MWRSMILKTEWADLSDDGSIVKSGVYDDNERIIYWLDGDVLKRKSGNSDFVSFAENIEAFTFECQDADGNATADTAEIRQVSITITAKTEKPGVGRGYDTTVMESVFKIRNMGLSEPASASGGGTTTTTVPTTTTTTVVGQTTTSTSATSSTSTRTPTSTMGVPFIFDDNIGVFFENRDDLLMGRDWFTLDYPSIGLVVNLL